MYRLINKPILRFLWRTMKMQEKSISKFKKKSLLLTLLIFCCLFSFSQKNKPAPKNDLTIPIVIYPQKESKDSVTKKIYSPRVAAIRSAILPGLGQIYNKKYWKLPIIYTALGISGGIFFYNLNNYRDSRFAYNVKYNMRVNHTDSALYANIKEQLKPLSEESLRFYRNQFRRDIDFSAVFFLIMWGLNVVDATVDAHLKGFDISPDIGLHIKPGHSEMAGTNGLSLVFNFH